MTRLQLMLFWQRYRAYLAFGLCVVAAILVRMAL